MKRGNLPVYVPDWAYSGLRTMRRGALHVVAIDLEPERFLWKYKNVDFLCADLLKADLPEKSFDVIMNCSAVERASD